MQEARLDFIARINVDFEPEIMTWLLCNEHWLISMQEARLDFIARINVDFETEIMTW